MNLPATLQEQLQFPALQIIDPNTGLPDTGQLEHPLFQSALISVLAAAYKATRTANQAGLILHITDAQALLENIFPDENAMVAQIEQHTGASIESIQHSLSKASSGLLQYIHDNAATLSDEKKLQQLFTDQRHQILVYLPAGLNIGALLNDEGLDDATNKMEGPISSLMNGIGNIFSKAD